MLKDLILSLASLPIGPRHWLLVVIDSKTEKESRWVLGGLKGLKGEIVSVRLWHQHGFETFSASVANSFDFQDLSWRCNILLSWKWWNRQTNYQKDLIFPDPPDFCQARVRSSSIQCLLKDGTWRPWNGDFSELGKNSRNPKPLNCFSYISY